jgi:hypothetical protein
VIRTFVTRCRRSACPRQSTTLPRRGRCSTTRFASSQRHTAQHWIRAAPELSYAVLCYAMLMLCYAMLAKAGVDVLGGVESPPIALLDRNSLQALCHEVRPPNGRPPTIIHTASGVRCSGLDYESSKERHADADRPMPAGGLATRGAQVPRRHHVLAPPGHRDAPSRRQGADGGGRHGEAGARLVKQVLAYDGAVLGREAHAVRSSRALGRSRSLSRHTHDVRPSLRRSHIIA